MKKILFWSVIALVMAFAVAAIASDLKGQMKEEVLLKGDEPIPNAVYNPSGPGLITDSPGDIIGWTQYDYQTNGSTGHRAALGIAGAVNFSWMNGLEINPDGSGT